jgi:site-specific DNA-methyltransferase (adenine-specific)
MEKIIQGDALEKLKDLEKESIDCICCDPPYGYSFMGKDWDKVLPDKKIWKECLRVLKPGGFAFIMSAPRQDVLSRMMINLEDVGFRTDFTSIYWTYASGFPKAHNIAKTIDKRNGKSGKVVGKNPNHRKIIEDGKGYGSVEMLHYTGDGRITEPESEQAKKYNGAYGGFQPKPATEIIIVVMKPIDKSFVDQALENGKGITWLDDCRIPYQNENDKEKNTNFDRYKGMENSEAITLTDKHLRQKFEDRQQECEERAENGRFPANLLVSDDMLNDGRNYKTGDISKNYNMSSSIWGNGANKETNARHTGDSGSFSRYFSLDEWFKQNLPEDVKKTYPYLIVPKASKSEKNMGLDEKQYTRKCRWNNAGEWKNLETKQYGNNHPTVKPIKLFAYLITMGSREGDTILDPFMGSGTTGIAAKLLNRDFIGIELSQEYIDIAEPRLEAYEEYRRFIVSKPKEDYFSDKGNGEIHISKEKIERFWET